MTLSLGKTFNSRVSVEQPELTLQNRQTLPLVVLNNTRVQREGSIVYDLQ